MDAVKKSLCFCVMAATVLVPFRVRPAGAEESPPVLTLQAGVKQACADNPAVKSAILNKEGTYQDVVIARAALLPSLNAQASITNLENPLAAKFGAQVVKEADRSSNAYSINLDQLVFDFGAASSNYFAARSSYQASGFAAQQVKNAVALNFIQAYLDLLESEKMLQVAQQEVEQVQGHLEVAKALYGQGVITRNDLLQAQVRLADSRQRLLTVKNLKKVDAARINNLLARPPQEEFRTAEPPDGSTAAPELAAAWKEAEMNRPELKALERQSESAALQEQSRRAQHFPRIFFQAGYSYTENSYVLYQDNWSTILGLSFDVFDSGATAAAAAKFRKQRQQLDQQAEGARNNIFLEVERYSLDLKNAREKVLVAGDAVTQAQENLKINKTRYQEGTGTATDVLDAITLLTTAQTNRYQALYDTRRAYAGLLYAVGRDLAVEYGKL